MLIRGIRFIKIYKTAILKRKKNSQIIYTCARIFDFFRVVLKKQSCVWARRLVAETAAEKRLTEQKRLCNFLCTMHAVGEFHFLPLFFLYFVDIECNISLYEYTYICALFKVASCLWEFLKVRKECFFILFFGTYKYYFDSSS